MNGRLVAEFSNSVQSNEVRIHILHRFSEAAASSGLSHVIKLEHTTLKVKSWHRKRASERTTKKKEVKESKEVKENTRNSEPEDRALPILPVRDTVLFPHAVLPLDGRSGKLGPTD